MDTAWRLSITWHFNALRYERKYRIEGLPAAWVEQAIRMHPASFRSLHPSRQVNNIYFDTPTLDAFYQNVAGTPQRRKHRLRWYGPVTEILERPVFEIKIKDGEMGSKENLSLPTTSWLALRQCFREIPQLKYLPLRPLLVNAYQLSYFGSACGRFRITVDWGLQFAPFHWYLAPQHFHYLPDSAIILELKYDVADDDAAQHIFDYLPFRQTKNSKYVTGINLVMG